MPVAGFLAHPRSTCLPFYPRGVDSIFSWVYSWPLFSDSPGRVAFCFGSDSWHWGWRLPGCGPEFGLVLPQAKTLVAIALPQSKFYSNPKW